LPTEFAFDFWIVGIVQIDHIGRKASNLVHETSSTKVRDAPPLDAWHAVIDSSLVMARRVLKRESEYVTVRYKILERPSNVNLRTSDSFLSRGYDCDTHTHESGQDIVTTDMERRS
jgi:hypothetical protein